MVQDGCDIICVNLVDRTDPTTVIDLAEKMISLSFSSIVSWWKRI